MVDKRSDDSKLVRRRLWVLLFFLAALMGVFVSVLYDMQVVHGADYLESSQYTIVRTETTDAARGKILDNLGRVLVSNRVSYQVTLDTSLMGTAQQRNEILMELLDLCREQGVTWSDTLPVTAQAPFTYTSGSPFFTVSTDDEGVETKTLTRLGKLAVKLEWLSADPTGKDDVELPTAEELVEMMCRSFSLEGGADEENRRPPACCMS